MPVSVVVGGQYGSEGKGKVAAELARLTDPAIVVRVGGTNSGHTAVDLEGRTWRMRQLPAGCVHGATVVLPAGSMIDPEILLREVSELGVDPGRVHLSPYATIIENRDMESERSRIVGAIGSTGSGTGAALVRRISRADGVVLAKDCPALVPFVRDTENIVGEALAKGRRIVLEGSQGFGLSVLHGDHYPHATSRDTTAATFLGEAGISPLDVDEIILVIRTFPIRVAGASGPLPNEVDWSYVASQAGLPEGYVERTTATGKIRRVATFDAGVVRRAIAANKPTKIVLNHCDYLGPSVSSNTFDAAAEAFLSEVVEKPIGKRVDWLGIGPAEFVDRVDKRPTRSRGPYLAG